jgi:hypothetical protein
MIPKPKRSLIPSFMKWVKETDKCIEWIDTMARKNGCLIVKLKNVTEYISLIVDNTEITVPVYFHNECYDFLRCIDIDVKIDKDGRYYCGTCRGDVETYLTEYELCVAHTFNQVIEYIESIASPDNKLVLRYKVNAYSDARIVNKKELRNIDMEDVTQIVDVLKKNGEGKPFG